MKDALLAREILAIGWEFFRVVLIIALFACFWIFRTVRDESWSRKLLYTSYLTSTIAVFAAFTFLNTVGHELLQFTTLHPTWSKLNIGLLTTTIILLCFTFVRALRSSSQITPLNELAAETILNTKRRDFVMVCSFGLIVSLWLASIVYLFQVARH